jgi:hypothetical protein
LKYQENDESQHVQRLHLDQKSQTRPKVLENLSDWSSEILTKREELIKTNKTKGNNKQFIEYKKLLPNELSQVALSWSIGLVLSDGTVQKNFSEKTRTSRIKIQQVSYNRELLDVTLEILKPYVFTISPVTGRDMYSLATITHEAFNILIDIFQNPQSELKSSGCVQKRIPSNIEDYLDEIALSSWFCGDGGKADYTPNQGKGIQFATHGFSLECNQRLAEALKKRYGWVVDCVYDYTNTQNEDLYFLEIDASSFNSVEKIRKPYILDSFLRKFPSPRSPNSRYLD